MVNLIICMKETEAAELSALLSFWYDRDTNLSEFILAAAREVADVAKEILKEKLEIPPETDTVVLGNLSAKE